MNRTSYFFILLSFLLASGITMGQTTGWNNGGGNWQKNGFVNVAGPTTNLVLWQNSSPGIFGTPIFIEGNYLVTMRFFSLTYAPVECYDLTTGNLLWSIDVTNAAGRSLPVGLRNEQVLVVRYTESQHDTLFALNVSDGSLIWTSNVTVAPYITETAVYDSSGNIYIGGNLKTYKINPLNGQMIWQTVTVPMASGSGEMAINQSNNTGYTLEQNGGISFVWAIDLTTGAKKYSHVVNELQPGGNVPQSALMVGNNGHVYVQLTEDNIAALSDNGSQLNLLWQTEISGNAAFSLMCVGADGSVYGPAGGRIIRLDPANGDTLNLSVPITQGGFFSPRLSASSNNMIYATNGESAVYAFDLSLNLIWSDLLPNNNTSGVCFAPSGLAAVAGINTIRVYTPSSTSTGDQPQASSIRVFPNPASSFATLLAESNYKGKEYILTDNLGRIHKRGSIDEVETTLDLSALPSGLYVIRIAGTGSTFKLVKE